MSTITVFKDMVLRGSIESRDAVVSALKAAATAPWRFDAEGSADAARNALGEAGIMIFERAEDSALPAARLVLWPNEDGFYVPNVVPTSAGELTIAAYNSLLSEFADAIARPIARRFGWSVGMTSAEQGLEDWLASDAAAALKRFSAAANKSTGASHPMDERRWFDFIIAVHRLGGDIGTDRLVRWLHEAEGWDETIAHNLASEYERGIALLQREAETR
jgi:hypothetical protein